MYRAPENSNRVRTIRSKFENNAQSQAAAASMPQNAATNSPKNDKNKTETANLVDNNNRGVLGRQLSDPAKRNIKRTPAFRCDRNNVDKSAGAFQRGTPHSRSHHFENKVRLYNSAVKTNCDNSNRNNTSNGQTDNKSELAETLKAEIAKIAPSTTNSSSSSSNKNNNQQKPALIKSKSSHDFAYIRSKFDNNNTKTISETADNKTDKDQRQQIDETSTKQNGPTGVDLSLLYTEPIPKSMRNKNCDTAHVYSNVIKDNSVQEDTCTISNSETLKISDLKLTTTEEAISSPASAAESEVGLTDTLKIALKRPLPAGPAPKKPPRTFEHLSPVKNLLHKNESFLHHPQSDTTEKLTKTPPVSKKDPRYMLNKLESALRNNKIRSKIKLIAKPEVSLSTTSGEDSDDSLLFQSNKSKKDLPLPSLPFSDGPIYDDPASSVSCPPAFSFNCLNGLTTLNNKYEKIKEPNSSFFVSHKEEPVYAEPFHLPDGVLRSARNSARDHQVREAINKNIRNSLYYMSTPLLCGDEDKGQPMGQDSSKENLPPNGKDFRLPDKQQSYASENSSLSSFTSDLESAGSTPQEESKSLPQTATPKIKKLIDAFEITKQPPATYPRSAAKNEDLRPKNRVDDLKMSLQQTLDRCFSTNNEIAAGNNNSDNSGNNTNNNDMTTTKDCNSDSEEKERKMSFDQIVNKFQTYVKTMPKYRKPKTNRDDDQRLFYCCLIVGWDMKKPQIKFKFPKNVEIPHNIEYLCYPEAASGPLDKSDNAQCYTLVITNDRGERTFGYCRRVMPEGSTNCLPLAYCILSKHRAPRFYKKILTELESRHGIPDKLRDELINEFYRNNYPRPGESIKIDLTNVTEELNSIKCRDGDCSSLVRKNGMCTRKNELVDSLDLTSFVHVNKTGEYGTLNKIKSKSENIEHVLIDESDVKNSCVTPRLITRIGSVTELVLTLHHDLRYEDADLKPLHTLPNHVLLKVFASLLLERKVIFISCVMSKLSSCVDALQSILYPFSWPHTFIPILPQCLWDVVESPTPVICGILSVAVVNEYKIEDGIVVDLDECSILSEEGDENSILSSSMKKAWEQGMILANTVRPEEYVHSVYLSDAYIKVFITCLKNYKSYIVDGSFQKDAFIRNGKTKGIRRFLKWFTETSLFTSFIETVISNPLSFTLFDQKMEMYGSEDSNLILSKLLEWKK